MEGTIGEIRLFAASFAPRSWWYCDGTLLPIRSNTALYSILGTTYGGDGVSTFGLPNLIGRSVVGQGQGPVTYYNLGVVMGSNTVGLTMANLPPHTHAVSGGVMIPASSKPGDSGVPTNNILASKDGMYSTEPGDSTTKSAPMTLQVGVAGSSNPISIMQASMGMNYIICLAGDFPARS